MAQSAMLLCHQRCKQFSMPCRLEDLGLGVGLRLLEVHCYRDRNCKRELRLLEALKFVHSSLWRYLFGHQAKDLEQSNTVSSPTSLI